PALRSVGSGGCSRRCCSGEPPSPSATRKTASSLLFLLHPPSTANHDGLLSPIPFSALVGVCEVRHGQSREFDSAAPCAPALPPPTRGGLAPSHHLCMAAAVTHLP
uniref:Uncharacterized protein n=1 Tax=Triticum urartu TaxID=4572 RepID=A0A8R7VGE1_TRIUA